MPVSWLKLTAAGKTWKDVWRSKPDAPVYDLGGDKAREIVRTLLRTAAAEKKPVRIITNVDDDALYNQLAQDLVASATATDVRVVYTGPRQQAKESSVSIALNNARSAAGGLRFGVIESATGKPPASLVLVGEESFRLRSRQDSPVAVSFKNNDTLGHILSTEFDDLEKQAT